MQSVPIKYAMRSCTTAPIVEVGVTNFVMRRKDVKCANLMGKIVAI